MVFYIVFFSKRKERGEHYPLLVLPSSWKLQSITCYLLKIESHSVVIFLEKSQKICRPAQSASPMSSRPAMVTIYYRVSEFLAVMSRKSVPLFKTLDNWKSKTKTSIQGFHGPSSGQRFHEGPPQHSNRVSLPFKVTHGDP